MRNLISACFSRPGAVILGLLLIFFIGANSYLNIPKEATPDVDIPVAYVSVGYDGISPGDAEKLLVKPLEKNLRTVAGLDKMTAVGAEGYASITLEFSAGEDIDLVLDDVREAVDKAKQDLPPGAKEPKVFEVSLSLFPILTAAIYGPVPEQSLIFAAREIKDRLESIPGVLEVDIGGDREELVEILVDAAAMESYGLNPSTVINLVSSNNQLVTAGAIDTGAGRMVVKVPGVVETVDDLISMPIKVADGTTIKFGDIAIVRRAFKEPDSWSRVNGEKSIVLDIKKRVGANVIEVIEASRMVIDTGVSMMPDGVKATYLYDDSETVKNLLGDLGNNVLAAILIVMVVIVATLGLRNGVLVGLAIPGSFLLGIAVIYNMGVTMNIIVLFSLILVAGMLVDGVIVTVEYADRKVSQGMPRTSAYIEGASRMAWPIIASTVTTLMVFLPLLVWPGIVGSFMKYLPITVMCVLSASLFMALIFIPVLGGKMGKVNSFKEYGAKESAPRIYRNILKLALHYPIMVVISVIASMVVAFGGYFSAGLGVSFFPEIEPEQAVVQVLARGDLSAEEKDAIVRSTEERIGILSGVDAKYAKTQEPDGQDPKDSVGFIRTVFDDWDKREKATSLIEEMRTRISGIPGAEVNIKAQQEGPGGGVPIHIELLGSDMDKLSEAVKDIRNRMEDLGGFVDITDSRPLPGMDWIIDIDRDAASRHGVSVYSLGEMVKLLTAGIDISDYRPDDIEDELDVKLRFLKGQRNLDRLQELKIPTATGEFVPLSTFAKLKPTPTSGNVERKDGVRFYYIDSDVEDGLLASDMVNKLKESLQDKPTANGVEVSFGGEDEDIQETQAFLMQSFVISLVLMIIVLMIQFNSAWQTFVTMSAIVLSTGGVFLGLWLTGRPFGIVMSGMGIIALAGIVVNNNIVLIDTYNEYIKRGYDAKAAAFRAGLVRFRPVLLTAITTILGLLPMVFEWTIKFGGREILVGAPSSQWWTTLSSTIAGGLTFATALTLLATPALLVIGAKTTASAVTMKQRLKSMYWNFQNKGNSIAAE